MKDRSPRQELIPGRGNRRRRKPTQDTGTPIGESGGTEPEVDTASGGSSPATDQKPDLADDSGRE